MSRTTWIDSLLSAQGSELLAALASESLDAKSELRTIARLRTRYPVDLVTAAIQQTHLRRRARAKFHDADRLLFTRAGLEQASSDRMATHHSDRFRGHDRMADLCTGVGGDLLSLAEARSVVAVDRDEVHARLASVNAAVRGVARNVSVLCADVRDLSLDGFSAVFVDPARRSEERRLGGGASEPSLRWCTDLVERVEVVGIKAAPALPTELVPSGWELEFVSEHRELKESLLWSPGLGSVQTRATVLPSGDTLVRTTSDAVPVRAPGIYLLDPDPAVTRAGLVEELAHTLGDAWKIDDQVAFLSANHELATPFGRSILVEASLPWNLSRLRAQLRALDIGSVDIRKRGSAVDVDDLQARLKLKGSRSAWVVLTRVANKPWAFVGAPVPRASADAVG